MFQKIHKKKLSNKLLLLSLFLIIVSCTKNNEKSHYKTISLKEENTDSAKRKSKEKNNISNFNNRNDSSKSQTNVSKLEYTIIDSFKIIDHLNYKGYSIEDLKYSAYIDGRNGPEIYRVFDDTLFVLNPIAKGNKLELYSISNGDYLSNIDWSNDVGSHYGSQIQLDSNVELKAENKSFLSKRQLPYYYLKKDSIIENFINIDKSLIGFYSDPYYGKYYFLFATNNYENKNRNTCIGYYNEKGKVKIIDTIELKVKTEGVKVFFRRINDKLVINNNFRSDFYIFYYDLIKNKWKNVFINGFPNRFIGITKSNNLLIYNEDNCYVKLVNGNGEILRNYLVDFCELDKEYLSFYFDSTNDILYSAYFKKDDFYLKVYKMKIKTN